MISLATSLEIFLKENSNRLTFVYLPSIVDSEQREDVEVAP